MTLDIQPNLWFTLCKLMLSDSLLVHAISGGGRGGRANETTDLESITKQWQMMNACGLPELKLELVAGDQHLAPGIHNCTANYRDVEAQFDSRQGRIFEQNLPPVRIGPFCIRHHLASAGSLNRKITVDLLHADRA